MSNLLSPPPWKIATSNGFKYREDVPEGYFLEQLCIIARRLNDINETLKDVINKLEEV